MEAGIKSWTIRQVFEIEDVDKEMNEDPFYLNYRYTCRICGFSFETGNVCGHFVMDDYGHRLNDPEKYAEYRAERHIMEFHREEMQKKEIR